MAAVRPTALLQTGSAAVAPAAVVSLLNDLDGLDGPLVLALDDYHVVDSQEVHDAVTRPAESKRLYERALASARRRPDVALPVTGDLHVGLADALCEQGDLGAATEHLRTTRDLGETGSLPENRHRWYVAMARLRQAEGEQAQDVDRCGPTPSTSSPSSMSPPARRPYGAPSSAASCSPDASGPNHQPGHIAR